MRILRNTLIVIFVLFGIIPMLAVWITRTPEQQAEADRQYNEKHKHDNDNIYRWHACYRAEDAIKVLLKAPSTANFGGCSNYEVTSDEDAKYVNVEGYVDAQNSYGAMLRTNFKVMLQRNGDDWRVLSIKK